MPVLESQTDSVEQLQGRLIDTLRDRGAIVSDPVEQAFRSVPRHLFLPGIDLKTAYSNASVVTKRDENGASLSSVSQPEIVTMMLEQLEVRPGNKILEIGSGGFNAALLSELVGPTGHVVSIDIDPDVIARANHCLSQTGYDNQVQAIIGDGEHGSPENGPFDRIIITAGAWDIPPAWIEQLNIGGKLVVPLRMRGLTRSIAFEKTAENQLTSDSIKVCGFVPMQGIGAFHENLIQLHNDVALRIDQADNDTSDNILTPDTLAAPRSEKWSGVKVASGEPFDGLDLWLASNFSGFGLLAVRKPAIEQNLVKPALPWGASAVIDGDSFAYLTLRKIDDNFEFGVLGHGSSAAQLTQTISQEIQTWDRAYRQSTPEITIQSKNLATKTINSDFIIPKIHTDITVSWQDQS